MVTGQQAPVTEPCLPCSCAFHKAASFHARCLAHACMSVNSVCTQVLAEKCRSMVALSYVRGDSGLVSPAANGRQLMV